jgi:hypothetical protein
MKMDEFRRQIQTIDWPVIMRVDGQEIAVNSREELMIPAAGNLICVYHNGAFQVIDCKHVSIIRREKAGGQRSA